VTIPTALPHDDCQAIKFTAIKFTAIKFTNRSSSLAADQAVAGCDECECQRKMAIFDVRFRSR